MVPPGPLPVQLHVQGPLPDTAVGVPALHKLEEGAEVNVPPLDAPQAPFTGAAVTVIAAAPKLQLVAPFE